MHKSIITLLCAAGMIISSPALAENLRIRPNAPARYTVKPGDTLWGISGKYLYRPWKWPALWNVNRRQIRNPHLIYPGQVLVLRYVNGRPVLGVERGSGIPTIKLHPQIRQIGSGYGISTLNVDFYRMFMKHPQFMTEEQIKDLPRIVGGNDGRVMFTTGDRIFVDGVSEDGRYLVFRVNRDLKDPITGENLGKLVEFSGQVATLASPNSALAHRTAEAQEKLNPDEYYATTNIDAGRRQVAVRTAQPMVVENSVSEIRTGDYLINMPENLRDFNVMPHEPEQPNMEARIISIMDGIREAGTMQTIILNKGEADGLDPGTVVGLYRHGQVVKSPRPVAEGSGATQYVNTPVQEIGLAMVYRTGQHVSSAIILESISNINVNDVVSNPGRDLDTFGMSDPASRLDRLHR